MDRNAQLHALKPVPDLPVDCIVTNITARYLADGGDGPLGIGEGLGGGFGIMTCRVICPAAFSCITRIAIFEILHGGGAPIRRAKNDSKIVHVCPGVVDFALGAEIRDESQDFTRKSA